MIYVYSYPTAESAKTSHLSNNQLKKLADAEFKSGTSVAQMIKKTKEDSTKCPEDWERVYAARKEAALARTPSSFELPCNYIQSGLIWSFFSLCFSVLNPVSSVVDCGVNWL